MWHIPRIPLQVTHEAPRNPSSRCAFFLALKFTNFFSISFSIHDGDVTAELKTWLKTLKPSLRIIALPPLTPDSPTRTRPGTAGPITWVRLRVKVTELSTHSPPLEVKPKHEFMTKPHPEGLSCETLRLLRLLCTILHGCLLVTLGGIALSKPSGDLLTLELRAIPDFLTPLIALVSQNRLSSLPEGSGWQRNRHNPVWLVQTGLQFALPHVLGIVFFIFYFLDKTQLWVYSAGVKQLIIFNAFFELLLTTQHEC